MERKTLPIFSKYEYAEMLCARAQQIAENKPITIKERISDNPIEIAKQEFRQKTIPLKIVRDIGGKKEVWSTRELNLVHIQPYENETWFSDSDSCDDELDWEDDNEDDKENDNPRKLTENEILSILSEMIFRIQQNEIMDHIQQTQKHRLRKQLEQIQLKPSKFKEFKTEILTQFYKSIVSPGEAAGVNSAQCIGEPVTQGTLNTFHSAGISKSNVTLGFARASELFNATSNPSNPLAFVYFTKFNESPSQLHRVIDRFPQATIEDLILDWNIESPDTVCDFWWFSLFLKMNPDIHYPTSNEWRLILHLDIEKLYKYNTTLKEISQRLQNEYTDIRCFHSPLNISTIIVFVDCADIHHDKINAKELCDIKNDYHAQRYYMHNIVSLEIRSLFVCGIYNIRAVFPRKISYAEYGIPLKSFIKHSLPPTGEWIIETQGTNLTQIFKSPFVDTLRTYSNDFMEMYNFFGIEGARTFLLFEFTNIVTASGGYINPRHIKILVDKMTHTGEIRAIARYGIETAQYDPISRASFEEVMKHLITSASFSEIDKLNSISSNIALGTKIRAGTGYAQTRDIPITIKPKPKLQT
jgi:DNA-directed RNA polymerase II subunit RPB1